MTSQVCSRRRDLSQSRCDPGIPGLLKVPIWNQCLKRHVYGSRKWHSRCSGLETFHVLEPCFRTGLPKFTSLLWDETSTWNLHLNFELAETWSLDHMKRPSSWMCLCVPFWLKQKFALQFPGFVPSCVCPRLSLRFSRFYSAGVAESQKDLESLTGEVSEMEKQVQLAGESRKKENDKFSRFYFAGGARTFGASCANEDTHHWLCKRTCRHAMGTVVCSLGANTNINFLTR